ncbi:MAG TPA: hypothetical protein VEJ63_13030 [Planctomycetota bacterium]|nr:hypothetical protein [Planctomycetota bacterium]
MSVVIFSATLLHTVTSRPPQLEPDAPRCAAPSPQPLILSQPIVATITLDGRQPFMPWNAVPVVLPVVAEDQKRDEQGLEPIEIMKSTAGKEPGFEAPHLLGIAQVRGQTFSVLRTADGVLLRAARGDRMPGTSASISRIDKHEVYLSEGTRLKLR